MKFLRNVAILLGGTLLPLYVVALVLLFVFQRSLLFVGNADPIEPPVRTSIYHARDIVEADGTKLTIWQAAPARPGIGTFAMFYGNASSLLEFALVGEKLRADGFGIVLASYRGYSGNSGSPSEAGLMADARAVLAVIPKSDGPFILWGHSLGSGVAARMASEGRGSALILESAYTAIVDVAARQYPAFPVRWLMKDRFDTLSLVEKIRMPVLIIHGTEDQVVPFDIGEALARAFGKRSSFVPILGAGHNPDPVDFHPTVIEWLRAKHAAIYPPAGDAVRP